MSYYDTPQYKLLSPFFDEPDFDHRCAYGFPVWMKRNGMKAWCGYVGVPKSHPWWGKGYNDVVDCPNAKELHFGDQSPISLFTGTITESTASIDLIIDVHGGITWAADHVPGDYRDGYWWFGFDCSHYNDQSPQDIIKSFVEGFWREGKYRDYRYVSRQCYRLAEQLSEIAQ